MQKKTFGTFLVFALCLVFSFAYFALATSTPPSGGASDKLMNPLPADNLTAMFLYIVKGFLGIIGVWGVLFVIIGGFRMITAAGNEEQYIAAKKTITWAILGVVVAVMSFSIIAIVQNLVGVDTQKILNSQPKSN